MSTRATFTFIDPYGTYHVYKHGDGYPSGAYEAIKLATEYAWTLPRFEADEFAASFVAANKREREDTKPQYISAYRQGGVRLLQSGDWRDASPADVAYRYEITMAGKSTVKPGQFDIGQGRYLQVTAYAVEKRDGKWSEKRLFRGTLAKMQAKYAKE